MPALPGPPASPQHPSSQDPSRHSSPPLPPQGQALGRFLDPGPTPHLSEIPFLFSSSQSRSVLPPLCRKAADVTTVAQIEKAPPSDPPSGLSPRLPWTPPGSRSWDGHSFQGGRAGVAKRSASRRMESTPCSCVPAFARRWQPERRWPVASSSAGSTKGHKAATGRLFITEALGSKGQRAVCSTAREAWLSLCTGSHRAPTYRPRGPELRGLFIPRDGDLAHLTPARRLPRARTHGPPGRSEGGLPAGVRGGGPRARSRVPGARSLLAPKPSNSDRTRPWLPLFRLREMLSAAQCFHQQHRAR